MYSARPWVRPVPRAPWVSWRGGAAPSAGTTYSSASCTKPTIEPAGEAAVLGVEVGDEPAVGAEGDGDRMGQPRERQASDLLNGEAGLDGEGGRRRARVSQARPGRT